MDFASGQVFGIKKIEKYMKKTKEQKRTEQQHRQDFDLLMSTSAEISALKSRLDSLCDEESIEASIYRLKAAELELNRHIRWVKESFSEGKGGTS